MQTVADLQRLSQTLFIPPWRSQEPNRGSPRHVTPATNIVVLLRSGHQLLEAQRDSQSEGNLIVCKM